MTRTKSKYVVYRFLNTSGDRDFFAGFDKKWGTTFVGMYSPDIIKFDTEREARNAAQKCARLVPSFTTGDTIYYGFQSAPVPLSI